MIFDRQTLRKARKDKGLSAESLASQLGVSRQTLENYENGITYPTVETLPRIARVLGHPLEFFFTTDNSNLTMDNVSDAPETASVAAGATSQANHDPTP